MSLTFEGSCRVKKFVPFLRFYCSRGFVLGVILCVIILVFMPGDFRSRVIGALFALVVSLVAAAVQFRRWNRRDDAPRG